MHFVDLVFLVLVTVSGYGCLGLVDRKKALDEIERWALSLPVGLGTVGAVLYSMNVSGIPFVRPLVLGVLGGGAALGLYFVGSRRKEQRDLAAQWRENSPNVEGLAFIALLVGFYVIGGLALWGYFFPNCGDAAVQHYPYAAIVFRTHHQPRFSTLGGSEALSLPPALYVCYAALWSLAGRIETLLPNLLPLPVFGSWCMFTLLATRRVLQVGDNAAAFAVLLFAALFEVSFFVGFENIDLLPMVLGGAAVYLLARDCKEERSARLPIAVLILGLCCWTKLHGVPFAGCVALGLVLTRWPIRRMDLKAAALLLIGTVVVLGPYLIRNTLVFGNPIYPVGCRWLGGYLASPWAVDVVAAEWMPTHPFWELPRVLCLVLREAPVLLGIPAFIVAVRHKDTAVSFMGRTAVFFLVVFLAVLANPNTSPMRFAGPALGILAWLGGGTLQRLFTGDDELRTSVGNWCFGSGLVIALVIWAWLPGQPPSVASRLTETGDALAGFFRFGWMLPFGACLLFVGRGALREYRAVPGILALGFVLATTLQYHQPLQDLLEASRSGTLRLPDWTATPAPFKTLDWLAHHDRRRVVVYSYLNMPWITPGALLPADDPLLEPMHRPGTTLPQALEVMRQMGVDYVLECGPFHFLQLGIVGRTDPIFACLGDHRFFQLVSTDAHSHLYRIRYPGGLRPERPRPGHPMPWLLEFAAHGPQPGE